MDLLSTLWQAQQARYAGNNKYCRKRNSALFDISWNVVYDVPTHTQTIEHHQHFAEIHTSNIRVDYNNYHNGKQ